MATKPKLTLSANEGQEHLKPYCKAAKEAAEHNKYYDPFAERD